MAMGENMLICLGQLLGDQVEKEFCRPNPTV